MNWQSKLQPVISEIERDAYNRGWEDCLANVVRMAQNPNTPQQPRLDLNDTPRKLASVGSGGGDRTIASIVEDFVKNHPGQRGNAIVSFVASEVPEKSRKVLDRTVRTALVRLKSKEKIRSMDGRWFHPEGASETTP
jgi:hypothetical protein